MKVVKIGTMSELLITSGSGGMNAHELDENDEW